MVDCIIRAAIGHVKQVDRANGSHHNQDFGILKVLLYICKLNLLNWMLKPTRKIYPTIERYLRLKLKRQKKKQKDDPNPEGELEI